VVENDYPHPLSALRMVYETHQDDDEYLSP
jgi:hypothetical protein